ncbi:MAG: selenoneine biosynthesis selenosugar synthase SenB, partial [bacterium]
MVTPAPPGSRAGNRVTALRWAAILRELGHVVAIAEKLPARCDALVAIHARKSYRAVQDFRARHRDRPLVVLLAGTDLYGDLRTSAAARASLELADRLLVLQPDATSVLPERFHAKVRVVRQSVARPRGLPRPRPDAFEACVVAHLRPVKDPFRAALAARRLPAESRLSVVHVGAATTETMRRQAVAEEARNPRWRWLGELPREATLIRVASSRLLVLPSKMEGGANVVSEAIVLGVPVLSSRISGSVGILGEDYPG